VEIYKILKGIFKPVFKVLYRPIIINSENIPKTGSFIFAGNHKKAIDPIMIAISTKRVVRFLAKKELHEGHAKIFFKVLKTIPVDRINKNKNGITAAIDALNNGEVIALFPEGTRNKTNNVILPFKFGAVTLAKKTNSPIIPFAITGEYKMFRKNISIEFGTPIVVGDIELEEANQNLMNTVKNLMRKKG